jgi:hypothetical protein
MTEPINLQNSQSSLQKVQRLMRESIGELAPFCQFITMFLLAMLAERSVSLPWIASVLPTGATEESNRKRIHRFLDDARVTPMAFAQVIARFLPSGPWILVMDRTNWFWGKSPINLLVLAVWCNGVAIPLLWEPLPRDGASDTGQRIALMKQFLDLWGSKRIVYLTGDREFIGGDWITWLKRARIPFRLRLRVDDLVRDRKGKTYEVAALFRRSQQCRKGQFLLWGTWVYLGGKPLSGGDHLVVASSDPGNLLEDYRNRWSIECLFQALKGRGFHLEETRIVEPDRISRLFGLLTLAYVLCTCIGQSLPQTICKATKRARKSIARQGLEVAHRVALWLLGPPSDLEIRWFLQALIPCKT